MGMLAEDIRIQASLNTTINPIFVSQKTKNQETSSTVTDDMSVTQDFSTQGAQSDVSGESRRQQSPLSIAECSALANIHSKYAQTTFSPKTNEDRKVKDEMAMEIQLPPSATKTTMLL